MKNLKANKKSTYLISDLHLDHSNIIRYCARPFLSIEDMNKTIVKNWNNTIRKKDIVYFLGDLAFGRGSRPAAYWLKQLNGKIHFIKGNHEAGIKKSMNYKILKYKGNKFLLIHNPDNLPIKWDGWVIHGHKHNNNMEDYPFINREKKTINVGVELLNYSPIDLDFLVSLL